LHLAPLRNLIIKTGIHTHTLSSLKQMGLIKCEIYLNGIVSADLEIAG
jgi:hypothetical protein